MLIDLKNIIVIICQPPNTYQKQWAPQVATTGTTLTPSGQRHLDGSALGLCPHRIATPPVVVAGMMTVVGMTPVVAGTIDATIAAAATGVAMPDEAAGMMMIMIVVTSKTTLLEIITPLPDSTATSARPSPTGPETVPMSV